MRFSRFTGIILYFTHSLVAALFAGVAMAISVSVLPAFVNPATGVGVLLLAAINYLPIAIVAVLPVAMCFVLVDACLRRSKSRLFALLLAGMGSGGASAVVLAPELIPGGLSNARSLSLIALGLTGGFIGACIFAYLTSGESPGQQSPR